MAASFNSADIPIRWEDNIAIEINWVTANIFGSFTVQGSVSGTTWTTITTTPTMSVAATTNNGLFDLNQLSFAFLRVVFTRTSGTVGTATALVSGKML